ncbi:MAG: TonB-dependent receptor [Halieaceae bacterium]|jgi:outer membrane receptor protein involved in Fe transport|nr:TonB-dependent receptor [Halieaceae bacterium]
MSLKVNVSALAAAVAFASAASAQTTQSGPGVIEETVVTGSRIARSGADTPTPTVVIGAADIAASGAPDIGEVLRELPAILPGTNDQSSAISFSATGLNLVDLRNLGTQRTLVLVDGRRQVGSEPGTTAVDLNNLPTSLIERVEVITGGASAVYGADAVSGVINIITKSDYEGLEFNVSSGASGEGDAERNIFNVTGGGNFLDGRGNAVLHLSYVDQKGIEWNERAQNINGRLWVPNPANTGPNDGVNDFLLANNVRQLGGQQQSMFLLDRGNGREAFTFNGDGSLRPFGLGPSGLFGNTQLTDGGEATLGFDTICPQNECPVRVPSERYLIDGKVSFEVADNQEVFIAGKFAGIQSRSEIGPVFEIPPFTNSISIDNPFVQDDLRALMQDAGAESIGIIRSDQELGKRGSDVSRELFQMTMGANGALNSNWTYNTYFQFGRTSFTNIQLGDVLQNRFDLALDAAVDPADGQIRCRSVIEGFVQDPGCVPANLLQPGAALTPDVLAFIGVPEATETATLEQVVAQASVSGEVMDLWAGPLSAAFGIEYRDESSVFTTSPIQQQGLGFFRSLRQATSGSFDVVEVFGELRLPLARDLPFAHSANLDAAIRQSDYSTAGSQTSWNIGADWSPIPDVRFRAVKALAVRAPNIGELFSPGSEGFITVDDPCDANFVGGGSSSRAANCAALGVTQPFQSNAQTINIRTLSSGNSSLGVEEADTTTLGVVLTPSFVENLSLTVDYFQIEISDAIALLQVQDILNSCVDLPSVNNVFCDQISRAGNGDLLQIRRQNVNTAELIREGIDFDVRYNFAVGRYGDLALGGIVTHSLTNEQTTVPGAPDGGGFIDNNGEIQSPEWRGRFSADWIWGPLSVNWTQRYFSSSINNKQPATPEDNRATASTGDVWYSDLQLRYAFNDKLSTRFGVENVFDELPPNLPETRTGGAGSGSAVGSSIFDNRGRFMYLEVGYTF